MQHSHLFHASLLYNSDVYVFGGGVTTIESFSDCAWVDVASMKTERTNVSACVIDDKFYIASEGVPYLEVYDVKACSFYELYIPFAGPSKLICSILDRLYLFSNAKTYEIYV
jgi:hypothetical protein